MVLKLIKNYAFQKAIFYFLAMLAFGYVAVANDKNALLWCGGTGLATGSFLLFSSWAARI